MVSQLPPRGLYAITPADLAGEALLGAVRKVITGGAVMIQYRAKETSTTTDARALQQLCAALGTPLIINDAEIDELFDRYEKALDDTLDHVTKGKLA